MNLKKLQALKTKVDQMQRDADKAAGALDQLKQRLKDEFDCDTIKQGQRKLEALEAEQAAAEAEFDAAFKKFEQDYGEVLEDE